jgi:hypothetical protein
MNEYKLLESHVIFNHPHGDYVISVAIESSPKRWKAYHKRVSELSIESLQAVAKTGEKFNEHRARQVFPEITHFEYEN